ncbi:hypothetical protein [Alteromonas macleodii]|uniref:hypothetical protein n=1 Tax=Alteromonas macleodii TaxID=28108 RepID=UPI003BF86B86
MLKIVIHVGPPKSGTSAVQKWLTENRERLIVQGFYYPEHDVDKNGISSGNLFALFESSPNGNLEFSNKRFALLEKNAVLKKCHTVILSSEFFFQHIVMLAKKLPEATFLAYIRFPLEVFESSYNQSVKRHGNTQAFGVSERPLHYQLQDLINKMKVAGTKRFKLRPYLKECFYGGNLISDFLYSVGLNPALCKEEKEQPRVNPSYTLEALEFKRWFNQFELGERSHKMDIFLQSINDGTISYSLVSPRMFEHHKKLFIKRLREVSEVYKIDNVEKFIDGAKHIRQKKYVRQTLSDQDFNNMLDRYIDRHPEDMRFFVKLLLNNRKNENSLYNSQRLKIIKKRMPPSVFFSEVLRQIYRNILGQRKKGVISENEL